MGIWRVELFFHDRSEGSYNRMNGAVEGESCWSEGELHLLLLFAENKSACIHLYVELRRIR